MKDCYTLSDLRAWEDAAGEDPIRLGVVGDPVAHSLSPPMQNAALAEIGAGVRYARFRISPNELSEAVGWFRELGFRGLNVTVPHKVAALGLVDEASARAREIGALNTIVFRDGRSLGENTDAAGFARAVREEFSVDLRDLRVLLLGAGGGAGRAVAFACAFAGCERLVLANRTRQKAETLAQEIGGYFTGPRVLGPEARLVAIGLDESALRAQLERTDLVVHASTLGWEPHDPLPMPADLLAPHLMIFDLIYRQTPTRLLSAAAEAGARGANGLTMLLYQGALAFELWFDQPAPIESMRRGLVKAGRSAA